MPSTTFVARRPGPFSALVQAAEIGGVRLEPMAPVRTHDRYYDTETGDLLRRGLALRVREQGGRRTAGLRHVEPTDQSLPDDIDLLGSDGQGLDLTLPPGTLALAVREVTADAALEPLLSLRQYRTPRVARDGEMHLGVLSFDVVVYEVPGSRVVSNEVEVRDEDDLLDRLADLFDEEGLEAAARSKFARALLRHPRTLGQPVLLLPDEARALEHAAATADIPIRRRASVALLDARGFRPDTIAAQTGMSMARVKHWRQQFREIRMGVLEPESAPSPVRRSASRAAAVRPSEPSMEGHAAGSHATPASASAPQDPPRPPETARDATPLGDGMSGDPTELADMAELLEMFTPSSPDTPMLMGDPYGEDDDDRGEEEAETEPSPPARRNPYPVVLGPVPTPQPRPAPLAVAMETAPAFPPVAVPVEAASAPSSPPTPPAAPVPALTPRVRPAPVVAVAPTPPPVRLVPPVARVAAAFATTPPAPADSPAPPGHDPFAEIDLGALRRDRAASPLSARYQAVDEPAGDGVPGAPVSQTPPPAQSRREQNQPEEAVALQGDTPLPLAARQALGAQMSRFESRAQTFLASRAPSDARRLLIAAQRLRLTVETFSRTLPPHGAHRLVSSLRPLVDDLDAGLDYARGVTLAPHRQDLARLSGASFASAAVRLGSGRHRAWGERSRRLLAHLDRQHQQGLRVGDFADVPLDDFVGEPGDVPTPTRLRHILGSTLWARFEAIRAFQDDLDHPTPDLAAHLAVALSALRFVLGLVEGTGEGYVADVAAALDAAEREVARARHRAVGAALGVAPGTVTGELAVVAQVWGEVTAPPFKKRLATVAAAV